MKRIKNFTLGILGATILSLGLYACSNDDGATTTNLSSEKTTFASKEATDFEDVVNRLKKDNDFVLLSNSLEIFGESAKQPEVINQLLGKENINEAERVQLAHAFGFASVSDAYNFDVKNTRYISNIYKKFDLSRFDKSELKLILEEAFEYNTTLGRPCADRFKTCKKGAYALYTLEMIGCGAAGVTIGGASFWCAGCLGAAVGSGCAIAATAHAQAMLEECQDKYDDCRGK